MTTNRTASADLPALLAGGIRARAVARAAAGAIDLGAVVVVGLPLGIGSGGGDGALVAIGAAAVSGALVLGSRINARTGRTPGRLALGLRAVDVFTGLPLGLGRPLADRRTGAVVLDVRLGRDPVLGVGSDRAAASESTVPRWVPAPPPAPRGDHL